MTEKDIEQIFKADFRRLFPKLRDAAFIPEYPLGKKGGVDVALRLKIGAQRETLLCEVVSQRFPKQIREKGLQLLETTEQGKKGYPVIIAPYISELGKEICKKMGVGFLDLSGNASLDLSSFYLEIEGKPNKFKSLGKLSGLFNPKGERVLRFYLLQGRDESLKNYRQIAGEVSVSLGQISKVNKKLDELGFWIEESESVKALDKKKLLDLWRDNFRFERNILMPYVMFAFHAFQCKKLPPSLHHVVVDRS